MQLFARRRALDSCDPNMAKRLRSTQRSWQCADCGPGDVLPEEAWAQERLFWEVCLVYQNEIKNLRAQIKDVLHAMEGNKAALKRLRENMAIAKAALKPEASSTGNWKHKEKR